ncbi:MAG: hypothetical protein ABW000_10375, partial [Actinoplanes sp.]
PLSAIAHEVGYTSEFAFAAAFRREYGVPPGRFRRETAEELPLPASVPVRPATGRWSGRTGSR